MGSDAITTTVTSSFTSTRFINIIPATSNGDTYSFTEENGTTTWFGKTPPATAVLITKTSFITVQPVLTPSPSISEVPSSQSTTHLTLYSTKTITETSTMTPMEAHTTVSTPAGAYTGLGINGWNASMTTLLTIKVNSTGTLPIKPVLSQPSLTITSHAIGLSTESLNMSPLPITRSKDKPVVGGFNSLEPLPYLPVFQSKKEAVTFSGTAYTLKEAPPSSTHAIQPREAPDIVIARIDDVVASWTNNWTGQSLSTPLPELLSGYAVTAVVAPEPITPSPLQNALSIPATRIFSPSENPACEFKR